MALPEVGKLAPNFVLLNQHNEKIELKQFRGASNVILYFYPRALTPGCTTQACGMRDYFAEFKKLNTIVLGISPDSTTKLNKFDAKYSFGFDLLSDEDHRVADEYGVWGLKKFMGREFMGILRTSFIIGLNGKLLYAMTKVNTKTHNDDLLAYMKSNN